jgi:hypothetical protein
MEFNLRTLDGGVIRLKGAWLLCDGGYHKWRCTICPYKIHYDRRAIRWSKWGESVRKDVECVFGRLKMRFRSLLNPIFLKNIEDIDNLFFCASIFHNMLLAWDGFDKQYDDQIWSDIPDDEPAATSGMRNRVQQRVDAATDLSLVGNLQNNPTEEGAVDQEVSGDFNSTRDALVHHFTYLWEQKQIKWLTRSGVQKEPSGYL